MVGCEHRGGPVSLWGMLALWHPSTPFAADYPDAVWQSEAHAHAHEALQLCREELEAARRHPAETDPVDMVDHALAVSAAEARVEMYSAFGYPEAVTASR
jgi:hypothetical protein